MVMREGGNKNSFLQNYIKLKDYVYHTIRSKKTFKS